jgi:hypothetical protein
MGLEPTTFCMAKVPADPTTRDRTDGTRTVTRKRSRAVRRRRARSGRRT